jgi:hypothetical protein
VIIAMESSADKDAAGAKVLAKSEKTEQYKQSTLILYTSVVLK